MLPKSVACYIFAKGAVFINCERHLGGFFRAISNAMAQDMQQNSEQLGLTSTQSMFLHHLWYRQEKLGEPTYAKDLEEFFDIKHSTVSGILQRMEASGFVELQASELDRRCKAVHLTPKAMEAHNQTVLHIQQTEAKLVDGMTEEEIIQFRRLLQAAACNLGVCMPHQRQKHQKEESDL